MTVKIPPRLRWACRRGMLELDVLLNNFLEEAFITLPNQEQAQFIKLLDCSDPDLFIWLTGKNLPADPEFRLIVEKIRHHAQHRRQASTL